MMRTAEVAMLTGVPLSTWHRERAPAPSTLRIRTVVLDVPKEELDRRIDARVGHMVERGFVAEVERLLAAGYSANAPGMTGTGYRDVVGYLEGKGTLEAALDSMRLQTRRYARRQLTWFRHQVPDPVSVSIEAHDDRVRAVEEIWRGSIR